REGVIDEGAAPLAGHRASLPQHLQVMADGWLADGAALGEVTGTHRSGRRRELPQDGDADGIGDRLQELHVRVCVLHSAIISKDVDIYPGLGVGVQGAAALVWRKVKDGAADGGGEGGSRRFWPVGSCG